MCYQNYFYLKARQNSYDFVTLLEKASKSAKQKSFCGLQVLLPGGHPPVQLNGLQHNSPGGWPTAVQPPANSLAAHGRPDQHAVDMASLQPLPGEPASTKPAGAVERQHVPRREIRMFHRV